MYYYPNTRKSVRIQESLTEEQRTFLNNHIYNLSTTITKFKGKCKATKGFENKYYLSERTNKKLIRFILAFLTVIIFFMVITVKYKLDVYEDKLNIYEGKLNVIDSNSNQIIDLIQKLDSKLTTLSDLNSTKSQTTSEIKKVWDAFKNI